MPAPTSIVAHHGTLMFAVARRDAEPHMVDPKVTDRLAERCRATAVRATATARATAADTATTAPVQLRQSSHHGVALFDLLTPRQLLSALDVVAPRHDLVCGAWIAAPSNPRFSSVRQMQRARQTTLGFVVGNEPNDGSALPVAALLGLHFTVLRARTPAQWAACDAVYRNITKAEAAKALGITHQAVSKAMKRAGIDATCRTEIALQALLDAAPGL